MALELSESLEKITLPLFARRCLSGRFFRGRPTITWSGSNPIYVCLTRGFLFKARRRGCLYLLIERWNSISPLGSSAKILIFGNLDTFNVFSNFYILIESRRLYSRNSCDV